MQQVVKADYAFTIQIDSYDNPTEELFNGTCCDCCRRIPGNERCQNQCETMLQFCLRNANHSRDDFNCTLWESSGDAEPRGLNPVISGAWQVSHTTVSDLTTYLRVAVTLVLYSHSMQYFSINYTEFKAQPVNQSVPGYTYYFYS